MAADGEIPRPEQAPPGIYDEAGRARFFSDPALDRLVSVVLQLTSEVWVLNERLRNIERLADRKGHITLDEIRSFVPDAEDALGRDADRDRFVQTVLGPLREIRK